jgi:vitamin B12 transporter
VARLYCIVLLCLFFNPHFSFAEDEPVQLPDIIVTGNRWDTPIEQTGNRVTTLNKEEIKSIPSRDIGAALEYMPGVTIDRPTGDAGSPVFPSVQGAQYYETTVLIDGIPFNDLTNGIGNIGQIPSELIDRVEVLHGPGGSEWGSSLGGVINIITAMPDKKEKNYLKAGGGDYKTGFGAFKMQESSEGGSAFAVAGAKRKSGGSEGDTRTNSNESGVGSAKFKIGDSIDVTALGYDFQGTTGSGLYRQSYAGYWEMGNYQTAGGGLTAKGALPVGEIKLTGYKQSQSFLSIQNQNPTGGVIGTNGFNDNVMGGSAIWHLGDDKSYLNTGYEYRGSTLHTLGLSATINDFRTDTDGLFIDALHSFGQTTLEGAFRASNEGIYGSVNAFNVALAQKLPDLNTILTGSVAQGYSVPTFGQKFFDLPGYFIPNPDLKMETAMVYQLGAKSKIGGFEMDLNGFYSEVNGAINTASVTGGSIQHYANFDKYTRKGVEAGMKWAFDNQMYVFANTLNQYVYDAATNSAVQDWARITASAGIGSADKKFRWLVAGTYKDLNSSSVRNASDGKVVINANAEYLLPFGSDSFKIFASVYNLGNESVWDDARMPTSSPRQVEGGIEWDF